MFLSRLRLGIDHPYSIKQPAVTLLIYDLLIYCFWPGAEVVGVMTNDRYR